MEFYKVLEWYRRMDVQYEIIKQLYKRELALLVPNWIEDKEIKKRSTRMLKCHSTQHFQFILKALEFENKKTPYNFYYSLARYYGGIPDQTLNFIERKNSQENKDWKLLHENHMKQFDFLLDVDAGDHSEIEYAYLSTKNIVEFLNECGCPHMIRFSGKGFHIIIPAIYFDRHSFSSYDDKNIYVFFSKIAKALKIKFSDMIDLSVYDSRRVCKLSYSLALFEKEIYVCYPFNTADEFNKFNLIDYRIDRFMFPVKMRGHKIFNQNNSTEVFIKKLGVEV